MVVPSQTHTTLVRKRYSVVNDQLVSAHLTLKAAPSAMKKYNRQNCKVHKNSGSRSGKVSKWKYARPWSMRIAKYALETIQTGARR
jgi:hypothetical protein